MESVSRSFFFFFLLPLLISLSLHSNTCEAQANTLITKTCNSAVFRKLCEDTLLKGSKLADNAQLHDLAAIAIQTTTDTAANISTQITTLINITAATATSDPYILQALSDCSQSYVDVSDQLVGSLAALDPKNYNDVNKGLSASMAAVELCKEGLAGEPASPTELREANTKFTQLCSNALSITNMLAAADARASQHKAPTKPVHKAPATSKPVHQAPATSKPVHEAPATSKPVHHAPAKAASKPLQGAPATAPTTVGGSA